MSYKETALYNVSNLKRIHDTNHFEIAVFGLDVDNQKQKVSLTTFRNHSPITHEMRNTLPGSDFRQHGDHIRNQITAYRQCASRSPKTIYSWSEKLRKQGDLRVRFNNLFLSDAAYARLKSENVDNSDDDEKKRDLKTEHISKADGIVLLYDAQKIKDENVAAEYNQAIQQQLNEIMDIKGYDPVLKDRMKNDQMCFFPIVIGVVNTEQKYVQQIANFAVQNYIDFYPLHPNVASADDFLRAFAETILDFFYYETLNESEIKKLTFTKHTQHVCKIL